MLFRRSFVLGGSMGDDVAATRRIVVSGVNAKFPMAGGIERVPLLVLMQELLANLS